MRPVQHDDLGQTRPDDHAHPLHALRRDVPRSGRGVHRGRHRRGRDLYRGLVPHPARQAARQGQLDAGGPTRSPGPIRLQSAPTSRARRSCERVAGGSALGASPSSDLLSGRPPSRGIAVTACLAHRTAPCRQCVRWSSSGGAVVIVRRCGRRRQGVRPSPSGRAPVPERRADRTRTTSATAATPDAPSATRVASHDGSLETMLPSESCHVHRGP